MSKYWQNLWKTFKDSLQRMKHNLRTILYIVVIEILFLYVYGFVKGGVGDKILQHVMAMSSTVSQGAGAFTQSYLAEQSITQVIASSPELSLLVKKIIWLHILLFLTIYFLYSLFEGITWKLSYKTAGTDFKLSFFIKKFFAANLLWIPVFIIYDIMAFAALLINTINEAINAPSSNFGIIATIFIIILTYFAITSYALLGKYKASTALKKAFTMGISKIHLLLPAYGIIIAVFYIFQLILQNTLRLGFSAWIITGVILILPAIAWAKIFIIQHVKDM